MGRSHSSMAGSRRGVGGQGSIGTVQALPLWPNVMSTGKRPVQQLVNGNAALSAAPPAASRLRRLHPGNAVKAVQRARQGAHILLTEDVESLWLTYRCAPLWCLPVAQQHMSHGRTAWRRAPKAGAIRRLR